MSKVYCLFVLFFFFVAPGAGLAQDDVSPEKIAEYKANVQSLVDFLEYSFNTLGNPKTSARDKDVIINQSYSKIFRDADVQIEDDLDDDRVTLINKDVQAYLKDIDFFFSEVEFALNVSSIDQHFTADKELYFLVTLTRTLTGITIMGENVSSNKERFIEVNFDDVTQDLRIVSIYTTKIDEKDELFAWWNSMPEAWRHVIGHEAIITDTIRLSNVIEINDTMAIAQYYGMKVVPVDTILVFDGDTMHIEETDTIEGLFLDTLTLRKNVSYRMLQRLASEQEIDVSENLNIASLEPLTHMGELIKVNCANTLIDDLSPLRNLINIESLDCSGTPVSSIAPLQYSISLKSLDIHTTRISDMELLANLRNLEKLNCSHTPTDSLEMLSRMLSLRDLRLNNTFVSQLTPLQSLPELQILDCSRTYVKDLSPLQDLHKLERLYISGSPVSELNALSGLAKLQTIYLDSTNVSELEPLSGLAELESIYCDHTGITASKANTFMEENPKVMVIHESVVLSKWWNSMSEPWQDIFRGMTDLDPEPSKEQLHQAIKITEMDISGNPEISELTPLKVLVHLRSLDCSNTGIDNLWPLSDLIDLHTLNCSNTGISNCEALRDLTNLEQLNLSHTQLSDIQCISRIKNLRVLNIENTTVATVNVFGPCNLDLIYADETGIGMGEVIAFRNENPEATVVYQSTELQAWWSGLSQAWKDVYTKTAEIKYTPQSEDLQRIADLTEIDISQNKSLGGLSPLLKLYQLSSLKMNDTQIADLEPISGMVSLKKLNISNNPIDGLESISGLSNLEELEFKNTQVNDLRPLSGLTNLRILDMAGTEIKKMNEIALFTQLEEISFYNTSIKSLSPLEGLLKLKHVKCYNTKLSEKKVRKFEEERPELEIIFY